jgi:DNA-binding MarR family transcriptional regulator
VCSILGISAVLAARNPAAVERPVVETSTKWYYGCMATESNWLDPREDRAWRAFMHAHHQLAVRLHRHLLRDSGLSEADYEILAVLSEHPTGRMPAQELCALVQWEKSRLSHQVRRMQEQGLIVREPNPVDARSVILCLLPAGRRAIEDAAPQHVHNVRRHFIDLLAPAELDAFTALNERVLRHLAEEPFPEQSTADEPAGLPRG